MIFKGLKNGLALIVLICGSQVVVYGQAGSPGTPTTDGRVGTRIIETGVPFLLIAPNARSGSMGDVGVALSPDANSIHWNPSKLAFIEDKSGISLSYSPWLQKLVPDISLSYLSGYRRIDEKSVVGGSIRFFSLGQIQLTDANRTELGVYSPSEFAIDGTYARKYGDNFSLGTALRFIYSKPPDGDFSTGADNKAGTALAADASAYYQKPSTVFGKDGMLAWGINISNIGNKISYVQNGRKVFLPTNLRVGGSAMMNLDETSKFTFALDLNKLLVPSPPVYGVNSRNELYIMRGRDPSGLSVPGAIFSSFTDAPDGLSEELKEITYSAGAEYLFNDQVAFRGGYFYESPMKGDRQYFTVGAGFKYSAANIDVAYTIAGQADSPLANTLRFSLVFNFKQKEARR